VETIVQDVETYNILKFELILPKPNFHKIMAGFFAGYLMKDFYDRAKGLPYVGFFFILDQPALLTRDRKVIKNILMKDFNYIANRNASVDTKDRLAYANLFFVHNLAWKTLRTKISSFFTSGKLKIL